MSFFLKLEGITGETTDPKHLGEFDIDEAKIGFERLFSSNRVPPMTPVITILRRPDKDSGKLFAACAIGTNFPKGEITSDTGNKTKTLTMSKIVIQSYSSPGHSQSQEPIESISLIVEKYTLDDPK